MKKTLTLVALLACALSAAAQDTVTYPYYRYMEHPALDRNYDVRDDHVVERRRLQGTVYTTSTPQTVYGVAALLWGEYQMSQRIAPFVVRIAQKRNAEGWELLDSVIWREFPPSRYLDIVVEECQLLFSDYAFPVYEIYFDHPVVVTDTFAVGYGVQDYNFGPVPYPTVFPSFGPCTMDDWSYMTIYTEENGSSIESSIRECQGINISVYAVFPILMPPDTDSYVCAGVDSVRVQGCGTGWVNVAWAPGSEDQDLFEIAYGVRGEDPERYASVTNLASPRVIFDDAIDTGVYYSARVRARCHHRCVVHDTLVWGPWSDLVHFYVGNHEPNIGIAEADGAAAFALNPNPTTGEVEVVDAVTGVPVTDVAQLTVMTMHGQTAMRAERTGSVSVHALPAGTYMVCIKTLAGKTEYLKLTKK